MPDITLLPQLAVFFGVRIDDLFSVNTEDELERIDYLLEHERLTDKNVTYAKQTLDAILRDRSDDVGALKRYARLILAKNNRDALAAGKMLERAMTASPTDPEIYRLYRQIRGGDRQMVVSGNDWFIRVCEPYAQKYPQNVKLYEQLIEAMIDMRYFERARRLIEAMRPEKEFGCLRNIFLGDIALAEGETEEAKHCWCAVATDSHKGQYEVGERFNRIGEYEMAITCFRRSFAAAVYPRDLSAVYSLAFLYDKLGRVADALETWQCILDVLDTDHGIADGEAVEWAMREMKRLRSKQKK